ncbi:hypothetical protein ES703_97403 [subsurface metagenome]
MKSGCSKKRTGAACDLCVAKKKTRLYFSDDFMWVADCQSCSKKNAPVPMGVIRRHTMTITKGEYDRLTAALAQTGAEAFGKGNFWIDRIQKKIKTHLHWHARRK